MHRIYILAEGQTEEQFVDAILFPHLSEMGIYATPVIVSTKHIKSGRKFKGGVTSYERVRKDILRLLGDRNASLVTTMIDYYGLPETFPGRGAPHGKTPFEKAVYVETAWAGDINNRKFLPYLSLHEYEALLFSKPDEITKAFGRKDLQSAVQGITDSFRTPEEINDDPLSAPSKRLQAMFPDYNKPFYGRLIAERIGLQTMRHECRHFNEWLSRIENIR